MNKFQAHFKSPSGIQKVSAIDILEDEGKNTAINQILQTREVRQTLGNILPNVLHALAGDSRVKMFIMKLLGKYLNKSLSRPDDIFEKKELQLLFENNQFLQNVAEPLPDIINGLFDMLTTMAGTLEELPTAEKKEAMGKVFSTISTGRTGELINRFSRIMIDIHKDDPEFLTRTIGPGLVKLIDTTDFGELKIFLDGTFKDMTSLAKLISGAMFDKPAKVVLLLSTVPMLANMVTKILEDIVGQFNKFPPDLVSDVILSLFREVDAKTVGMLANKGMELFRKINVGSALIGDPGMPQCRLDFAEFIDEFTDQIDIELLWKFKDLLGQSKERFNLSLLAVMKKKPELVIAGLKNAPKLRNYQLQATKRKLGLIENLPEEKALDALKKGLADTDSNSMAEIINIAAVMINRLNESDANLLPDLVDEFISTLDLYEIEDTVKFTMENLGEVIKPLGHVIFPNLIKMTADWLSENGNGQSEELIQARETIVQFLNHNEVAA